MVVKGKVALFALLFVSVVVLYFGSATMQVSATEVQQKELNTLENPTWMAKQGLSKGTGHDRQDFGVVLPAKGTIEVRQINPNFKGNVIIELLNDDRNTEKSVSVGSNWVTLTADVASVPFAKTTFTVEKPKLEYKVSDSAQTLPIYKPQADEKAFFTKWDSSGTAFALVNNDCIQILVPAGDKAYLKKMNDFKSIDALLAYYDTLFETYNKLEGLSFTPEKATDKNIANRYFAKADKHGSGSGYYSSNYTAETSGSVITFWLKAGWGGLHEIAHGYQGSFMNDSTFGTGEVWNNIFADTMQKKMLGANYYNGWLYSGDVKRQETFFDNAVFKAKTASSSWGLGEKLYALILMKDKAGDDAFAYFNQTHRAAANAGTEQSGFIMDLLNKYYGEASHFDFAAYTELIQAPMSLEQKEANLYSGNKAVYPLGALLSGNHLKEARKKIDLDTKWGLVDNTELQAFNLKNNATITFDMDDFNQIKGKMLQIKDGKSVIREIKITTPTMTVKNVPIGIYSLDIPTGQTKLYEPSTNYLPVSDGENHHVIQMKEMQTSAASIQKMVFTGLGDSIFATADVDAEAGTFIVDAALYSPHAYFGTAEYASVEVFDDKGNSVFKHVMTGVGSVIGKFQTAIKPGYVIKVKLAEPSRFSITGSSKVMTEQIATQTFEVTKYGLINTSLHMNAKDALANYKENLIALANKIENNPTINTKANANSITRFKKMVDFLDDSDSDKLAFQKRYNDILTKTSDLATDLITGDKIKFQIKGSGDINFAYLALDLDAKTAEIMNNAGKVNNYFDGSYASLKIYNQKGREVLAKDYLGNVSTPASKDNMAIDTGYFITVTHEEPSSRLVITNEETGEYYPASKQATYVITEDGLKQVEKSMIPVVDTSEMDGSIFDVDFFGPDFWNLANVIIDVPKHVITVKQLEGEAYWDFKGDYASIKIYDGTGKPLYSQGFNGSTRTNSKDVTIAEGYYITITHQEYETNLVMTNKDTKQMYKIKETNTYRVTANGLAKVANVPVPDANMLLGQDFSFKMLGLSDWNFADMTVNLDKMELTLAQRSGQPHAYFGINNPYVTVKVRDKDGIETFHRELIGNINAGVVTNKANLKIGDYVLINHAEAFSRLKYAIDGVTQTDHLPVQNAYRVTADGLLKVAINDVPTADATVLPGKLFDFAFSGEANQIFANVQLDLTNHAIQLTNKAGKPNANFASGYATVTVYDEKGRVVYMKDYNGSQENTDKTLSAYLGSHFYVKVTHQEGQERLLLKSGDKVLPVKEEQVYQVLDNGIKLVSEKNIPVLTRFVKPMIYTQKMNVTFAGIGEYEFASMVLDRANNNLHIKTIARQPHAYFTDVYASIEVRDTNDKVVYSKSFIGNIQQKAEEIDVKILDGYTVTIMHREPGRLIAVDSDSGMRTIMKEMNEFQLVPTGLSAE